MMHTDDDENHSYAHETTMSILEQLKPYSWESKAVMVLAAFSVEYGTFFHLSQVSAEDSLGRSLAVFEGYEEEFVPSLTEAMHEFPAFVYWVVLTIVACALHFKFFLGSHWKAIYNLSSISSKIFAVHSKIKALTGRIRKEIAHAYGSPESSKGMLDILIEDLDLSD
ncbi:protein SIEVE ELEMENT OCCLUSION B-like [Neltuma alba]|uniref:protein SIEVE ELEMENT OCCLUSION B-like n=1 Tax=Neltuma alba TaxID=207710 RepID=UPI0010A2CA47|nr:protein SIEVE ELEMENT OCCLUSION B-like [Prosopis alba]